MGKVIRELLQGARDVLVLAPPSRYHRPKRAGFVTDMKNLRKDAARIAYGLRSSVDKYVEQTHDS